MNRTRSGYVVNRLQFPLLAWAVLMLERDGVTVEEIDEAMITHAGHKMGPFEMIDHVGVDVVVAQLKRLDVCIPKTLKQMIKEHRLGKKTGVGFYAYLDGERHSLDARETSEAKF